MRLASLVLIMFLVIPFSYALTASIGNARMILRPVVEEGETTIIDKSILVKNVNNISVKVSLEPDDRFKKIVELFENELVLQPSESKEAKFRIILKSGGRYEGKILVSFAPADLNVKENGVGLSSNIIILADGPVNEHYYEVMGDEDTTVSEEETGQIEETTATEGKEGTEESGEGVSVSIGQSRTRTPKEGEGGNSKEISNGHLIGILIVVGIIIVGLGIFFIAKAIK